MENLKSAKTWIGIVVVALLEVSFVGIFDAAKPGVGKFWGWLISIISFGSATVRDRPYKSAAMDPYPLPSLIILFLIAIVIPVVMLYPAIDRLAQKLARSIVKKIRNDQEHPDAETERTAKRVRALQLWSQVALICMALIVGQLAIITYSVISDAVLIKRVYETDIQIISPHIDLSERLVLDEQFASMKSKADYQKLMKEMETLAATKGVNLRAEGSDYK